MGSRGKFFVRFLLLAVLVPSIFAELSHAACPEKIFWSKDSPDKSLVFQSSGNEARILICSLKMVRAKDNRGRSIIHREFSGCVPVDPAHKTYSLQELDSQYKNLVKMQRMSRVKKTAKDTVFGFFVAVGGTRLGQGIARLTAAAGGSALKAASNAGPRPGKYGSCVFRALGFGTNIVEGSRVVANDPFLRFFPAYIGSGVGLVLSGVDEHKDRKVRRTIDPKVLGSSSKLDAESSACLPKELDMRVEDYADDVKKALRLAAKAPSKPKSRPLNRAEQESELIKDALETAPVGSVR
ncbi:MAG: hypothetical protein A2603_02960 [Bdellovibrionales bacterium RIFOXYD1_FULL_55_31]|nr:MAG: hypothetical protein A2603_02960 [Bdellovibrionales bacterium RIFOXYD1_FULL_55_31]